MGETTIERDLRYAERPTGSLLLDLYRPARDGAVPVVVWLHGGGWFAGDRALAPDLRRYFASRGIAMASIEYRLSGQALWPAQLHDVRDAVRFLRAAAGDLGLRPDRIGLWGGSAGAHLAAIAGLAGRERHLDGEPGTGDASVTAVAASYPPVDLEQRHVPAGAPLGPPGAAGPRDSPEARLIGGTPDEQPERARDATVLTWVTSQAPAFQISHGTGDRLVPARHSELLHAALVEAGIESDLFLVDGFGHGFLNPPGRADVPAVMDDGRLATEQPAPALHRTSASAGDEPSTFGFDDVGDFFTRHLFEGEP
ncbi:alpha/beta hydrolase fold domain-containing protein [Mumia qirimensis]|uniref:alpha/beta hydrolase fold domain-containing protein n=1 Tax=Mumia qirimensis TaxID=3234852 RepID=UPI00351CDB5F